MKLRTKFSILTCTLAAVIVAGVSLSFYIAEKSLLLKEMKESRKNAVDGLKKVTEESLISSNEILIVNYLKQFKSSPGVKFAMVTDPQGHILAHTDMSKMGTEMEHRLKIPENSDGAVIQELDTEGGGLTVISRTAQAGGRTAVAWVAFSKRYMEQRISSALSNTKKRILGVSGIGLVIGILGSVLLSAMMTRPIKKMAVGAASIGRGNLNTKIEVTSQDELGGLARDLNRMAVQLAELDRMKQDFVSSVTHEFRSPLNAMAIHFELLLKGRLGDLPEKQQESIQILQNNATRLSKFIDDLLDVAKIESGKMSIEPETFDPAAAMKEVFELYRVQAEKKNIGAKLEIAGKLPDVYADPDRTKQVISNLLNNAIKFTAEGDVTLKAKNAKDGYVEIFIKDTGIGIPEDQMQDIFDKFRQVKGVRKKITGQKGTGLGLSIVKGIVESQGGEIRVESEHGRGSVFSFTIPVK